MSDRKKLIDEELDNVSGGNITYTWDGDQGSLGMNGVNKYQLLDKNKFVSIYNTMKDEYSDADIIKELRQQGVIRKP